MMQHIILASTSPRRKLLLEWAEVPFEIVTRHTEENFPPDMKAEEVPAYIAKQKALSTKQHLQEAYHGQYTTTPVLAADTIVYFQNEILGKPTARDEAIAMLMKLSGNTHKVITGVAILHGEKEISFTDITEVAFHSITPDQIIYYVDKYKPFDKAGAYAIQEWIGVVGIKSIKGDFYNVMGLPVSRVLQHLDQLDVTV
ncbi:MAG: maf [Chitinophagaceae bacterium]|nr:maf [Chitinophagaceae bacterium]